MKEIAIILVCMMVCFSLFTGCTDQKNGGDQDTNVGNSVEFDVTDIDVDAETRPDAEDNSDSVYKIGKEALRWSNTCRSG